MPEGHSIRRQAIRFQELFVPSTCSLSSPQGRFERGAELLNGRVMTEARSIGKHLFLRFDPDSDGVGQVGVSDLGNGVAAEAPSLWLHVHLGLYGNWRFAESPPHDDWVVPDPVGAVRVRIQNARAVADLSGPTCCEVLTNEEVDQVAERLGPDPLNSSADSRAQADEFARRVRSSRRSVGELVMDQSVIAGVGNIYRAEGLFRQGISPMRKGANVSKARLQKLWSDFEDMLQDGVILGKIVTRRPDDALELGSPERDEVEDLDPESLRWYVYHRTGRPCLRCGRPVQEKTVAGRRLFWCGTCQR